MFRRFSPFLLLLLVLTARAEDFLPHVNRVVFLGDSITYSGQYVDDFEAYVFTHLPQREIEVLDLGLPSETVSGLSEPGHANNQFPRPDLHERLARVLEKTKPSLVFACYGMNDGIYLPFSEERFAKFQDGIRRLHEAVVKSSARIVHLTPPVFDPVPLRKPGDPADGFNYDTVLEKYSAWLLEQRKQGWEVIDVHTPMKAALEAGRAANPAFAFAKDGVHANAEGHCIIARALLEGLGQVADFPDTPGYVEFLGLVRRRERILTDAWLNACGHLRPGMAKGLPLEEAEAKAAQLRPEIAAKARTYSPLPGGH